MVNPIQGLRVTLRAADVADPIEALRNLNINILDLDRIRGISEEGVLPEDIRTLSNLSSDLEKELVGVFDETRNYSNYLSVLNDGRSAVDGNMTANASIIAASFKFNAIAANNMLISSELSTSRVSAWSSIGSSLYYGSKVTVGNQVELSNLTIDRPIKQRRFESEIPTHKVRIRINGVDYDAYAMKNIPIKLTGYFSSARNIYFTVTNAGPTSTFLRPSWVVTDLDNNNTLTFQNRLASTGTNRNSTITILGSRAKEKIIEFFYPITNIVGINLPNMRLYDFPTVEFPTLKTATLYGSDFKEMPNFKKYAPTLETLDISSTNLMRSNDPNLRSFNDIVVAKLPTSLKTLKMTACYAGDSSANLAVLDSLTSFVARGDGATGRRMSGISPAVNPLKIDTYDIALNLFDDIHPSVRISDTLRVLNISVNNMPSTANVQISTTNAVIEEIYANGNRCAFIDVNGKATLKTYYRADSPATGVITNLFSNCTNLTDVRVQNTNITGALPSFGTNTALSIFYAWSTKIQPADSTYAISETTFGSTITSGCRPKLKDFSLSSPLLSGSIHPNAMDGLVSLVSIFISSSSNGISGEVPQFRQSGSLRSVNLRLNNMTGPLHSFSANPNMTNINLSFNKLSGAVPGFRLSSLTTLVLNNNNFTSVGVLQCPSLRELNLSSNQITAIPDLSGCGSIQSLLLNSNPLTTNAYTAGTFVNLTALRNLNVSNCNLPRGDVDKILIDLGKNYDQNPRTNVEINLTGNQSPSNTEEMQTFILARLRTAGWTIRTA